jgi:hypothetical protein
MKPGGVYIFFKLRWKRSLTEMLSATTSATTSGSAPLPPRTVYVGDSRSGPIWSLSEWRRVYNGKATKGSVQINVENYSGHTLTLKQKNTRKKQHKTINPSHKKAHFSRFTMPLLQFSDFRVLMASHLLGRSHLPVSHLPLKCPSFSLTPQTLVLPRRFLQRTRLHHHLLLFLPLLIKEATYLLLIS